MDINIFVGKMGEINKWPQDMVSRGQANTPGLPPDT